MNRRAAEAVAIAALRQRDPDLDQRLADADAAVGASLAHEWSRPGWGRRVRGTVIGTDAAGRPLWDEVARDYDPDFTLAEVFARNCAVRGIDLARTPPAEATRDPARSPRRDRAVGDPPARLVFTLRNSDPAIGRIGMICGSASFPLWSITPEPSDDPPGSPETGETRPTLPSPLVNDPAVSGRSRR